MSVINIAVVGVGSMGRNHARVYSGLRNVNLVAVVDTDLAQAQAIADQFGCLALTDYRELPGMVDAVSIAVPAVAHAEVGCHLLDRGLHCLIEKPLAVTEQQCLDLIAASERSGAKLMVGHIELFNPAVTTLLEIIPKEGRILSVEARRMSWVAGRNNDVDVLMDLMVHDIDIVQRLLRGQPNHVQAGGQKVRGEVADHVTSLCAFENGVTATFTASKVTPHKIRELTVLTDKALFMLDFPRQEILVYRRGQEHGDINIGHYILDVVMERVFIRNSEPLVRELEHFVDCIRNGKPVAATGENALDTLRTIRRIQESLR